MNSFGCSFVSTIRGPFHHALKPFFLSFFHRRLLLLLSVVLPRQGVHGAKVEVPAKVSEK